MKSIPFQFDTYLSSDKVTVAAGQDQVACDSGCEVNSYNELIEKLATISFFNHEYNMFYRGQGKDYQEEGESSLYPSIFRGTVEEARSKKDMLNNVDDYFNRLISENTYLGGMKMLRFAELRWAILQHYEICNTPFLDMTKSLHVACTFALKDAYESGYLYVFGLPHFSSSMCASIEEEVQVLRLFGAVPPKAKRPLHQDGFLAADFPSGTFDNISKSTFKSLNFNRRLVCKFKLIKRGFWENGFSELPGSLMMPTEKGVIHTIIKQLKEYVDKIK